MSTRTIGSYTMLETIGAGGFSKVRLGVGPDGSKVALKILNKDKVSTSSSIIKQVEREVNAMAKIKHPHVIKLHHVDWNATYTKKNGSKVNVILVVLELATGGELFEMLAFSGSFEETIARAYFHQLIQGLAHCHANGIAHRDLKPENLLMDSLFQLKIADFGFSNVFTSNDKLMSTECGTPGYMSPEMFRRGIGYDATCVDVWACGVVLFIMIAGFPPFQRPSMSDWWFNKLANNKHHLFWEAHSRSAYFSDSLKDIINKILTVDPNKRITVADIQNHPWYQGPTVPAAVLTAEMTKRKAAVDEQKHRDKAGSLSSSSSSSRAAVTTDQGQGGAGGGVAPEQAAAGRRALDSDGDMAMERALGSTSLLVDSDTDESIPSHPPSFQVPLWLPALNENAPVASSNDSLLLSDLDASLPIMPIPASSLLSDDLSQAKSVPPVFDESIPSVLTRFSSVERPRLVLDRLCLALDKLGGRYSVKESEWKAKVRMMDAGGEAVEFVIQLYQKEDCVVVEHRKRAGDSTTFRKAFAGIRAELADILAFNDIKASIIGQIKS